MKKIFFLFILFFSVDIFSEERDVDLNECISIALQNHPRLISSIEDSKKSVSGYRIAKARRSVIINGVLYPVEKQKENGPELTENHMPGQDTYLLLYGGVRLDYNLYDAKQNSIEEIAKSNIDISKLTGQQIKNEVLVGVKNAYYSYLLSKNTLKIREEMVKKYKKKSDLAKQLFEQGSRPIFDVTKAEYDMADAQLQYEKAKNSERKTKLQLFQSMGLEEVESVLINPKDIETIPDFNCTLDNLYRLAEIYSPSVRIITLQKRVAKLNILVENAAHYPKVDLALGLGTNIYGRSQKSEFYQFQSLTPGFLATIVASIPIYTGGAISAKVESAESDYNKLSYREKELLVEMKNQIRDSFKSLEEYKKQIDISILMKKNAERYLLLAQRSYENGAGTLLELQDAELSIINADIYYLNTKYGYLLTLATLTGYIGIGENSLCKSRE